MIKAVLFDFGGVLSEAGRKGFIRQVVATAYGLGIEDVDMLDVHLQLRRGEITDDEFFDTLNQRHNGSLSREEFLQLTPPIVLSSDVIQFAQELRDQGLQTGILSNIFKMNADELRREGCYDGFDPIVLSYEEGYAKPDEGIYHVAIDRLGVRPEEILFIDDQEKCLPPAEALGMYTLLATSPTQIVEEAKAILAKVNG